MDGDVIKEDLNPDILFLSENVISPLFDRKDQSYSLNLHLKFLDQKDDTEVSEVFVENIADPLFDNFSKGNPKYKEVKNPEENIGKDFEIIESLYNFLENNRSELNPENVEKGLNSVQSFLNTLKTQRAFDYIDEVCRRSKKNDFSDMEGIQITTPYDYNDLLSVVERDRVESKVDDDIEAVLEYGPDRVGYNDVLEGYDAFNELNSMFCERKIPNQVSSPECTVFAD